MSLQVLRLRQVAAKTGLCRSNIYAKIKEGAFPKPIPLGARAVGFLASEIDAWIQGRTAARDSRA